MSVSKLLNVLHMVLILTPYIIFVFDRNTIEPYLKWLLLITIMVPLHWIFFDNQCILTILSKKAGDYTDTQTESSFSEVHMRWFYEPIMKHLCWEWNNDNLNKMVTLHWIINIVILWYYIFLT